MKKEEKLNHYEIQGTLIFKDDESYKAYCDGDAQFNNGLRRNNGTLYRQPDFEELPPSKIADSKQLLSDNDRYIAEMVCDILKPIVERLSDAAVYHIEKWLETKAIPAVKKSAKKLFEDVRLVASGIRAGISGETPKALQLIETKKSKAVSPPTIVISTEEACEIINSMRYHATHLAFDIKRLSNALVIESNAEDQLKYRQALEKLATQEVMTCIVFLLANAQQYKLDTGTVDVLSNFHEGYVIVNDNKILIEKLLSA